MGTGTAAEIQQFKYDAFGRQLETTWTRSTASVDIWTNRFNARSQLIEVNSPTGSIFYEYDIHGRRTRLATRGPGFLPANSTDHKRCQEPFPVNFGETVPATLVFQHC